MCRTLKSRNFAETEKLLPKTIKEALEEPPISEIVKVTGRGQVVRFVEFELVKMSALVSVGGNLNDAQVQFIATQLVELFPNETLGDFKLCFERGCIGQYGEIYRMDGIVLRKWMEQYLDEKYQTKEDLHKSEMQQHNKQIVPENTEKDWHKIWLDSLPPDGRKIPDIPQAEINAEGQPKPKKPVYVPPDAFFQKEQNERIRSARKKYFLERNPDAEEEEVQAYLNSFPI